MQSYVHGASAIPLIGATLGDYFDAQAARFGANEAVVSRHQNRRLTYAQLKAATDELARGLIDQGRGTGLEVAPYHT